MYVTVNVGLRIF